MKDNFAPRSFALSAVLVFLSGCGPASSPPVLSSSATPPLDGPATIRGKVFFSGRPPAMNVPEERKLAPFCREKPIIDDTVVVAGGGLQDTLVRIEPRSLPGPWPIPTSHIVVTRTECMARPRIAGAMVGQAIELVNADPTFHNIHAYYGSRDWLNLAMPNRAPPVVKDLYELGIIAVHSEVHPWIHSFVVVTDHPFFTVSAADGSFMISGVPSGEHRLEAWHPRFGWKRASVVLARGSEIEVHFTYDGTELESPESGRRGEISGGTHGAVGSGPESGVRTGDDVLERFERMVRERAKKERSGTPARIQECCKSLVLSWNAAPPHERRLYERAASGCGQLLDADDTGQVFAKVQADLERAEVPAACR